MTNALLPGLGGPMGRHARPRGVWFEPLPWLLLTASALFLVLALRQWPCLQTEADNAINAYIRLCYSDLPVAWTGGLAEGLPPVGGDVWSVPPLLGFLVMLVVRMVDGLGAEVRPASDLQTQLDGLGLFMGTSALVLYLAFLGLVVALRGLFGRERGWILFWVAASPVVLAAGLINWDLVPVSLSAAGLWLFARRNAWAAGLVLAAAMSAGPLAGLVALALAVVIWLRGSRRVLASYVGSASGAWLLIHAPYLLTQPDVVVAYYRGQIESEASFGSLWYLMRAFGWDVRAAGNLGLLLAVTVGLVVIAGWYVRRRRPRVGSAVGVAVLVWAVAAPSQPPQLGLWLLLAVVLARPYRTELAVLTAAEVIHWAAVWGWLSGHLTADKYGPTNLYYLTIIIRVVAEVWILLRVLGDVAHPVTDPQRTPDVSDPIGGVLNDGEVLEALPPPRRSAPGDLVEPGGGHATGDGDLVAHGDAGVTPRHEEHG